MSVHPKIDWKLVVFMICLACISNQAASQDPSLSIQDQDGNNYIIKKFPDNKWWLTENLKVNIPGSFCYGNDSVKCHQFGRLYTWEAAKLGCSLLGQQWRLSSNEEWLILARDYGGIRDESRDSGRAAFKNLTIGGDANFNAVLGGSRDLDGTFARLNGHGLYWTSTNKDSNAWFYNFGNGLKMLNRHDDGEKRRAFSVRCIRDSDQH